MPVPYKNRTLVERYIPKRKSPELDIQQRVCSYLRKEYPHVLFHSDYSAGLGLTQHQATINKSLQFGSGLPDLYILHPGRVNPTTGLRYVGLAMELKKDGTTVIIKIGQNKGRLTSDPHIRKQAGMLQRLNAVGWYGNFAIGYQASIDMIDWYFERPKNTSLF
jgi:hypothetical protein